MGDILFIVHEDVAHPGLLLEWVEERGHRVRIVDARSSTHWDEALAYDAIVPLGSNESVTDPSVSFVPGERAFVRSALAAGVPVLGICFGAQLLASALGAVVSPADSPEVGWHEIRPLSGAQISEGPWFQWHVDRFDLPPGAELLAESPRGPQAFIYGRSVGLQFHPEVTEEMVRTWMIWGAASLTELVVDIDAVIERTIVCADKARRDAFALFDAIADRHWR